MSRNSFWFQLVGLGFAVAGLDKLVGLRPYRRLARHWLWQDSDMRQLGAIELAGGAMVAWPATRQLGGALLAVTSAAVLATELEHRDTNLAGPRAALLMTAVAAAMIPNREPAPERRALPAPRAG